MIPGSVYSTTRGTVPVAHIHGILVCVVCGRRSTNPEQVRADELITSPYGICYRFDCAKTLGDIRGLTPWGYATARPGIFWGAWGLSC